MEEDKKPVSKADGQLAEINGINYVLPTRLSLVAKRQLRENFAERQTYTNSAREIQFRLNASSDFVYGKNSYLTFDISVTADAGEIGFPADITAANLFSRLLIEDQSGQELERVSDFNEWAAVCLPYVWSRDYRTQLQNAGTYDATVAGVGDIANYDCKASSLRVVIPMWWLSGVFDTHTFIPPTLLSGMLIRLTLETPARAFSALSGAPTSISAYTIDNPRIVCDSLMMAPAVQKQVMSKAQGGLGFVYTTLFRDSYNVGGTSISAQINKAVARALRLDCFTQVATPAAGDLAGVSTRTQVASVRQTQCRVGDLYITNQPVRTGTSTATADVKKNSAEVLNYTYWGLDKTDTYKDPPINGLTDYRSGTTDLNDGKALLCHSLTQHPYVKNAGLSVNNSRVAEVRIDYSDQAAAGGKVLKVFMRYIKVATSFPSRAVVKE